MLLFETYYGVPKSRALSYQVTVASFGQDYEDLCRRLFEKTFTIQDIEDVFEKSNQTLEIKRKLLLLVSLYQTNESFLNLFSSSDDSLDVHENDVEIT